jgi:hypothetical protein
MNVYTISPIIITTDCSPAVRKLTAAVFRGIYTDEVPALEVADLLVIALSKTGACPLRGRDHRVWCRVLNWLADLDRLGY